LKEENGENDNVTHLRSILAQGQTPVNLGACDAGCSFFLAKNDKQKQENIRIQALLNLSLK